MEIKVEHLTHIYNPNTPFEQHALNDVNITIKPGTFVSVIGHTGSGKSTFVQHLNGLLKPTKGCVAIGDRTIEANTKTKNLKELRRRIGMVFQYPEHQLFEETVEKDICFGPLNFGYSMEEAKVRAREVLKLVHLPESLLQRSPFELSGGQMRRVAIAGVLAIRPEIIILDEPTAGLDPKGRRDILSLFAKLHKENGLTTIMVTHNMDDAALYSDEVMVMDKGSIAMLDKPETVFSKVEKLKGLGLDVPETMQFLQRFSDRFDQDLVTPVFTIDRAAERIVHFLKEGDESR